MPVFDENTSQSYRDRKLKISTDPEVGLIKLLDPLLSWTDERILA